MVRIRQVSAAVFEQKKRGGSARQREASPQTQERQRQQEQFARMLSRLTDTDQAFEVRLEENEKPLTVRQRLMRAAQDQGKEIVVRKSERGLVVGLSTPERRSNRGRRRAGSGGGATAAS